MSGETSDWNGYAKPETPTSEPPGSSGKMAVMCTRFEARVALHHEADPKLEWLLTQDIVDRFLEYLGL